MSSILPACWVFAPLEEVVEIRDDLRKPVNSDERANRVGPYPYYGATGQVGWIDDFLMDGEYILLGEDGAPFLDRTRNKAYRVEGKSWVNNHAHVLRGKSRVLDNRFLLHALNCTDYREFANGTTRLKLTQGAMRRIRLPIAPLNEQRRIVDKIEELFSDLDAGVAALERAKANLRRYRASVLKAAVDGSLTAEWRTKNPDVEPASVLLERILKERRRKWEADQLAKFKAAGKTPPKNWQQKYIEPPPPDTTDLHDLPEGWCWITAEQLSDETRAITYGVVKLGDPVTNGVPTLRSSNVRHLRLELDNVKSISPAIASKYKRTFIEGGELLFTVRGTLGGVAVAPHECRGWNVSREVAVLIPVERALSDISAVFIASPPLQDWLSRNSKGIAYTGVNIETLKELPIPLAPLDEVTQIVDAVQERLSAITSATRLVNSSFVRAGRLRQSILKHAFEGKLVPQDPSDEPGGALLERLQSPGANGGSLTEVALGTRRSRSKSQTLTVEG